MKRISILLVSLFFAATSFAQITSYPYIENFDSYGVCTPYAFNTACAIGGGWSNDPAGTANWLVGDGASGASSSGSTGPGQGTAGNTALDHTTGLNTGNFLFIETSGSGSNKIAILESPVFDFTSVPHPVISFWYHMYGATMGDVELEVSTNGGATWTNLLTISGQQQTNYAVSDPWRNATVDLCSYAGQSAVEFRFRGLTGTSFTSDMALDDIEVFNQVDDVAMVQILSPTGDSCGNTATTPVSFQLTSAACNPISSIPVCYSVNGGGLIFDTIQGPINPGDTISFTFGQTANFGGVGSFNLEIIQKWSGDANASNDTLSLSFNTVFSPDPPIGFNDSACAPDSVVLVANLVNGDTIIWKDSSGAVVGSGNTFVTPVLGTTTAYFAHALSGANFSGGIPGNLTTTFAGGNGCGAGNMFDVTAISQTVTLTDADINASGAGTADVYFKVGTWNGFQTNLAAWTLVGSYPHGAGIVNIDFADITIPAGQTYGIYIDYSANYTNGANTYTNGTITISTGIGHCSSFDGCCNPRSWNGTMYYTTGGVSGGCESPGTPVLAVMFERGSVNLGPDTFLCYGDTIALTPGVIPGATYSWWTASGVGSGSTAPILNVWQTDTVIVTVTPIAGCTITDTVLVTVGNPITFTLDTVVDILCWGDSTGAIQTSIGGGNTIVDGVPAVCGASVPPVANCSPSAPFDIGIGTLTTNVNSPFYSSWEDQRMQLLFTAAELQAAGMTGGQITDIGFDVVSHSGTDPMTLTISMGCSNISAITGFESGLTQVFTTTNYLPAPGGYTNHVFQTPYEWDGVSNLVVEICMDKLDFGGTNSMRYTPTGFTSVYLQYQDGGVACNTPYNTTRNNADRPNTRFGFCNAGLDTIPLAVLWNTGDTTDDISMLPAGSYSVTITDAYGCTRDSVGILVSQPDSISVMVDSVVNNACGDSIGGGVYISPMGGTPPYSYLWSNGQTTQDIDSLSSGNYQVTITDANNCIWISQIWAVTEPSGGTVSVDSVTNVDCFGDSTGAIYVTMVGGTPPFVYQWSNGASTTDLLNVPAGNYDLTISDSSGCNVFTPVTTISQNSEILISLDTVVNTFCFGDSSGEIQISVSGGVPPYTYMWSNGDMNQDLVGVPSGSYDVTVMDSLNCVKVLSNVVVNDAPPLVFSVDSIWNVECFGDSTGAIFTSVSGGTPMTGSGSTVPYMYSWSNLLPVEDPTGIPAGSYDVTVTDALGCTFDTSGIVVTQPPLFIATIDSIEQNQCYLDTIGMIYVSITGGIAPFSYGWSSGDTTQDIGPLAPGDYSLTVTDDNGCVTTLEGMDSVVTIIEPGELQFEVDSIAEPLCFGDSTGAIFTTIIGGCSTDSIPLPSYDRTYTAQQTRGYWFTAPVNFTITGLKVPTDVGTLPSSIQVVRFVGPPIPFPGPGNAFTTLYVGQNIPGTGIIPVNISVNAGDVIGVVGGRNNTTGSLNNSYAAVNNFATTLDGNPITLQRLVYQANLATAGAATTGDLMSEAPAGVISRVEMFYCVGSAGAPSSYSYLWSTGDTTDFLTNIPAGTYNVTVGDTFGCTLDTFVTVNQPSKFRAQIDTFQNVQCNGDSNGMIAITLVGGTQTGSGTTFTWSTGDTTNMINNLGPGSYTLNAVDDAGCTFDTTFIITEPMPLTYTLDSSMDNNCFADTFGALYITPMGGTMPYSYLWSNGDTTQDLINSTSGPFTLELTDANGCRYVGTDTINSPPEFTITLDSITHVDCNGAATGGLNVTVNGGVPPYSYSWSNGDTTAGYLSGAVAGSYDLTVSDDIGCQAIETNMVITEPQVALSAVIDSIVNATCASGGSNDGAIYVTAFGGTPPYTYAWTGGLAPTDDPQNVAAGTYDLTITDFNGCTFVLNSVVVNFNVPPINVDLGVDTIVCDSLVLDAGSFPNATYLWSTGARSRTITVTNTGTYWVEVTDPCGPIIDAIQVTVQTTPQAGFGYWGLNNTITFQNLSNTSPGSSYLWDFGDGNTSTISDPTHLYTSGGQFIANLTVSNSCGTDSYTDTVYVVLLSLEDMFADENFAVYPNPTDQFINIDLTGEFEDDLHIELYDPLGRMVQRDKVEGVFGFHHHMFDVSGIAAGTYLVRITDGNSDVTKQVVVH